MWVNEFCQDAIPVLNVIHHVRRKHAFADAVYGNSHTRSDCVDLYFPPVVIHDLSKGNRIS